jgi:hypothetical protein
VWIKKANKAVNMAIAGEGPLDIEKDSTAHAEAPLAETFSKDGNAAANFYVPSEDTTWKTWVVIFVGKDKLSDRFTLI